MAEKMPHQYEVLLMKAVADYKMARLGIAAQDRDIDDATILFHVQQAAEKLLKALLSFHGVHFEKNHDLTELIEQCRENRIDLPEYVSRLSQLNPFAVVGRYGVVSSGEIDLSGWTTAIGEFMTFVVGATGERAGAEET